MEPIDSVQGSSRQQMFTPTTHSCIDDEDLESRSISELVSFLRTAFRIIDFDKVEEILVAKEVKMKKEIENKNKECELLQTKYEFLRLDKLSHGSTHEQISEIQKLKELIVKVDEDREKKKKALEQYEKLLGAAKKRNEDDKKIIEELNRRNSELQCVIDVVKKTKDDDKKILEELNRKNSELECAIEVVKKTKDDDKKIIEVLNRKLSELECEIEAIKKTKDDDEKIIEELNRKNSELESAKKAVEHDFELCKRKYDELGHRVSQLEDSYTLLKNGEPVAPNRTNSKSGAFSAGSRELVGKKGAENDKIENPTGTGRCIVEIISDDDLASKANLSRGRENRKRRRDSYFDGFVGYDVERDDEKITILPSESNGKGKESLKKVGATLATAQNYCPAKAKHVLEKHFSSSSNDSKQVMNPSRSAAVMLRQCAEKVGAECKSHSKLKYAAYSTDNYSEDCSIFLESDDDMKNRYDSSHLKPKDQGKRCNKKWGLEAEMLAAFEESDALCMEAVCILYRQSNLIGKPRWAYWPSRHRGFNEADVLRGSTLALFLINGDPQGKLKKSAMELKGFDISGLSDCRRIAIEHSKQLFEIYKNEEDRFQFH